VPQLQFQAGAALVFGELHNSIPKVGIKRFGRGSSNPQATYPRLLHRHSGQPVEGIHLF